MTEVQIQGCCINIYQNYLGAVSSDFLHDPKEIFEGCNVDQSEECSSMALVSTLTFSSCFIHTTITYYSGRMKRDFEVDSQLL